MPVDGQMQVQVDRMIRKLLSPCRQMALLMRLVAAGDGDLRIYVSTGIQGVDWWQSEFLLRDGKIEYRGKGGDQEPRVQIETGKTVTLDFRTNTGTIQ